MIERINNRYTIMELYVYSYDIICYLACITLTYKDKVSDSVNMVYGYEVL